MKKRLALLDKERCVGCQSCMFACARRPGVGGLAGSSIWVRSAGGVRKGFVVIVCRACPDPPCARVCPTDALPLRPGGGVRLKSELCIGCRNCAEACPYGAVLWDGEQNKPEIYKTSVIGYDHEPIFAVGSLLGGTDVKGMFQLLDEAEVQGLDVMSMGVTLAWATEALQRGLISTKETDGLALEWGNYPAYLEAAKRIVSQPNDFYRALARGAEHAAALYGGQTSP